MWRQKRYHLRRGVAVILENGDAPSPWRSANIFLNRLNEADDRFGILTDIAAQCDQRAIEHRFGCKMGGPRITHVHRHMELPQRRPPPPPVVDRQPTGRAALTLVEDCDDNGPALWRPSSGSRRCCLPITGIAMRLAHGRSACCTQYRHHTEGPLYAKHDQREGEGTSHG
jgi:hypothetical protein